MEFTVRPYKKGEEKYVAEAHRRIYSEEYRWGESFTRYAAAVALDFAARGKREGEELWIAEAEGRPVGSIMLCRGEDEKTGQLRLFLVENAYRRQGIGKALTDRVFEKAGEAGYEELILWTASPLHDAIRSYEKLGFRAVEEIENSDWSLDGEKLNEVKMSLRLG